jgi:hypothetical protein
MQLHVVRCIPTPMMVPGKWGVKYRRREAAGFGSALAGIEIQLFVNEAMAATWFTGNDAEFLQWCDDHRSGFVVNTRRKAGANYVMLHKASCLSVIQRRTRGAYTERGHIKCCADSIDDLRVELQRHVPEADLRACPLCKP